MKLQTKTRILTSLLASALLLTACSHDNPVMQPANMKLLKAQLAERGMVLGSKEMNTCMDYFSDTQQHSSDSTQCTYWAQGQYARYIDDITAEFEVLGRPINKKALPTFDDFIEAKVWQTLSAQCKDKTHQASYGQ